MLRTPLVLSLVAGLLVACTAAAPANPTPPPTPATTQPAALSVGAPSLNASRRATVRLGSAPPGLNNAGILIAQQKGWFDEQGIELQMIPFGNAPDIAAPLAAGQLDAGLLGINSGLLNALARGVKVKFAADVGSSGPGRFDYVLILVRKELFDSAAVKIARRMSFPSINPDGRINVQSLEDQQKFYLSIGTQEKPIELNELVDQQFIDGAVKVLGPYQ